jgi:hypothetical protein
MFFYNARQLFLYSPSTNVLPTPILVESQYTSIASGQIFEMNDEIQRHLLSSNPANACHSFFTAGEWIHFHSLKLNE